MVGSEVTARLRAGWALPMEISKVVQTLAAAGLGAGFYSLWTAQRYVKNRSFDPRYRPAYLTRWFMGLVAGTILGLAVEIPALKKFDSVLLALVGGWSADAVAQILQRLSDTLVAAVKGDPAEQSKAERERYESRADILLATSQLETLRELGEVRHAAIAAGLDRTSPILTALERAEARLSQDG